MYFPTSQLVYTSKMIAFLCGWLADRIWGDPSRWPHPIVWFGKIIAFGEKKWNKGANRRRNGLFLSLGYVISIYILVEVLQRVLLYIHPVCFSLFIALGVFFGLAGKTLEQEVTAVFKALERSLDEGRRQVARIVGRDTEQLSAHEIRLAAFETLSENLSDGVIAPMFWFVLLGLPGMMAYKMINTLDSMIGYKNERYREFGEVAAHLDDVANYIPARLTAFLMLLVSGKWNKYSFVLKFGKAHASPNSGYPEATLAAILDCRFGGTHNYFGQSVEKPFIGIHDRELTMSDLVQAVRINRRTELLMGVLVCLVLLLI